MCRSDEMHRVPAVCHGHPNSLNTHHQVNIGRNWMKEFGMFLTDSHNHRGVSCIQCSLATVSSWSSHEASDGTIYYEMVLPAEF